MRKTLATLRKQSVPTLLWANGPVAEDVKEGHLFFHEHPFNVGQHVAHNTMLDEMVRLGYEYHVRVDDDCWITSKSAFKRILHILDQGPLGITGRSAPAYSDFSRPSARVVFGIRVDGLEHPPPHKLAARFGRETLELVDILGGIFRVTPMAMLRYFRWEERMPMGMGEATQFSSYCKAIGANMFRIATIRCTHGDSTRKQEEENPEWAYGHDMLQYTPLGL